MEPVTSGSAEPYQEPAPRRGWPVHADPAPGSGRRSSRAHFTSDAEQLSLDGAWWFRLSATAEGTGEELTDPAADLSTWQTIRVPAHWVLEGHGLPLYTNTAFPFPIDPPRVPDDNPTGDYRRTFLRPPGWKSGRVVLRFGGVDSCATVWLNGTLLGHSQGSRLPFEFDVTEAMRPGRNEVAVRVQRWSAGSYLEDQDMWWLPGIFRSVDLLHRPAGGVDDVTVRADYDHTDGSGALVVAADRPGRVIVPELGVDAATGEEVRVPRVEPWSADVPRLYHGTLVTPGERVQLTIGFRSVAISEGRFLVNGRPIRFRGVNRHEHDPARGRALDRETMRRDVELMKQHNINAVRTSHYPPDPYFLQLCDEYGLWVVEECDIETHGFIYAGWRGNPLDTPVWRDALLDRTARMVERDKNHPSVVVWSMANESDAGRGLADIEAWIRQQDPTRPLHYERDRSYRHSDFYSVMYPSVPELERIARREEETPDGVTPGGADDERRRGLPFLLCEYAHAMGNGPGSLADYDEILSTHDRCCGGFVWEWIDHGLWMTAPDGTRYLGHGGDIDHRPNGGRFCLDGLVFADRTPSPGLTEYAAVIAPVRVRVTDSSIMITNDYDTRDDLDHLAFDWVAETDGEPSATGDLAVPCCPAGTTVSLPLPDLAITADAETWLTVRAFLAEATPWASAGHVVARAQQRLGPGRSRPLPCRTASVRARGRSDIVVGPGRFDRATGALLGLGEVDVVSPVLDVWRAPTENDHGQGGHNPMAADWVAVGMDRFLHRVDAVEQPSADELIVRGRSGPATQTLGFRTELHWRADAGRLHLTLAVDPVGDWSDTPHGHFDVRPARLGLRLGLPAGYTEATWFGRGPEESYQDSCTAAFVGRFRSTIDALQTRYPVPQENGNHLHTRWLRLSGPGWPTLQVEGSPHFDFTARRWTSEQLQRADHPHDLHPSDRVWLNLDHAQQGLGSASCGPALPDRYRLPLERCSYSVILSLAP